jgi:hypothetical protein
MAAARSRVSERRLDMAIIARVVLAALLTALLLVVATYVFEWIDRHSSKRRP